LRLLRRLSLLLRRRRPARFDHLTARSCHPPGQDGTLHCLIDLWNRPVLTARMLTSPFAQGAPRTRRAWPPQRSPVGLARTGRRDGRGARGVGRWGCAGPHLRPGQRPRWASSRR
jgi:hypothetical protein